MIDPNMHMHECRVFPFGTDSSCRQAKGDFKSSNHSDTCNNTCNTWRIFDTTSYTIKTLLPLPPRRSHHPRTHPRPSADTCTEPVPKLYPLTVSDHYLILGSSYQVIGFPLAFKKGTGGCQWTLIRFAFSGHAVLSGYAWNWSCYWSCPLSIETFSVTAFMDCIGSFFRCGYFQLCMHAWRWLSRLFSIHHSCLSFSPTIASFG